MGLNNDNPFQNVAGGTVDLDVTGLHIKDTVAHGQLLMEANPPTLHMIDTGGDSNDKWLMFRVDGGVAWFQSLNDDGSTRTADILSMDLGTGAITATGGIDKIRAAANNTNADQYVAFLDNAATGAQQVLYDTSLTYNPVTNGLKTAGYFSVATSKGVYLDGGGDTYIRESGNFNEIDFYCGGQLDFRMENDGDFHAEGDVYAFSTTVSSDIALKENINVIPNALDKISQLKGVSFDWKRKDRGSSVGLIAQDVEKVLPELVKETTALGGNDSHKNLNYNGIIGLLVESIKELKEEITELKNGSNR